jgi:hypothetical protein
VSHDIAVGVAMGSDSLADALVLETKSGRAAVRDHLVDAWGDGDLAVWAGAPFEKAMAPATCSIPQRCTGSTAFDAGRAGEAWRQAEAAGRFSFPRKGRSCGPARIQANGVRTMPSCTRRTALHRRHRRGQSWGEISAARFALQRQDATCSKDCFTIRGAKFGKSRLILLHESGVSWQSACRSCC